MKQSAATFVPIILAALAANCGMGDDDDGLGDGGGAGDAAAGAPDAGGSAARAGAGGSSGASGSSGESSNGGSAGHSAGEGGDAGGDEGGTGGIATGGAATGGTSSGGAGVSAGAGGDTGGMDATGGCAGEATGGSGGDATPAITAVAWLQPDSCERFVAYEVRDVRDQDGMPVTDYTCEWTFSDGGVETTCAGDKTFGELPLTHHGTVVVRDSATGAMTTAMSEPVQVIEPQAVGIYVSSDDCMQFTYDIDRQFGCGGTHVFDIQPAENIVTPAPWSMESQTLEVSAPGVYTLKYTVEGCAESYARTCIVSDTALVTVGACP